MVRFAAVMLFALSLGLVAEATPVEPSKCDCCKCKSCACDQRIPLPMPRPVQGTPPGPKAGPIVSFEEALRDQIEGRPETIRSRRVLNVLDMEDGPRRDRILKRMERHAIVQLDLTGDVGKIDWSSIDWAKVFEMIIKLLAALAAFI